MWKIGTRQIAIWGKQIWMYTVEYCLVAATWMILENMRKKETRHMGSPVGWFNLYETSRICTSLETESRLVFAGALRMLGRFGRWPLMVQSFFSGWWLYSKTDHADGCGTLGTNWKVLCCPLEMDELCGKWILAQWNHHEKVGDVNLRSWSACYTAGGRKRTLRKTTVVKSLWAAVLCIQQVHLSTLTMT